MSGDLTLPKKDEIKFADYTSIRLCAKRLAPAAAIVPSHPCKAVCLPAHLADGSGSEGAYLALVHKEQLWQAALRALPHDVVYDGIANHGAQGQFQRNTRLPLADTKAAVRQVNVCHAQGSYVAGPQPAVSCHGEYGSVT